MESLLSAGRRRGYLLAAALGAITPFCSCSTIPMLRGLIRARAGFGPMMVFLFASPLLNPVIVVLLAATFGLALTAIYVLAALGVSLVAGWLLQSLGFERHIRQMEVPAASCGSACSSETTTTTPATACCTDSAPASGCGTSSMAADGCGAAALSSVPRSRYAGLWREAWSDFVDVLPYLLLGIAIGSLIYGFMPTGLLETWAGADNPLAIPVAAVIGIPLYIRAEAVIPLAGALMAKGVGAGTVLALIIGSAGASLTELILLRALFRLPLLALFVLVILAMAMIAGYTTWLFF